MTDIKVARPRIFDVEKKQRFWVEDSGEFVENVYHEENANALVGKLVGRHAIAHEDLKRNFTASDVVNEGYLFKRGSWVKSWKRRYFILRRDIGELCYFDSLEKLTLLGTVPLSKDSIIWEVDPNDVDGVRNVIAVKSRGPQTLNDAFLMRSDDKELIDQWLSDITSLYLNIEEVVQNKQDTVDDLLLKVPSVANALIKNGSITSSIPSTSSKSSRTVTRNDGAFDEAVSNSTPPVTSTFSGRSVSGDVSGDVDSDDDDDDCEASFTRVALDDSSNSDASSNSFSPSSFSNITSISLPGLTESDLQEFLKYSRSKFSKTSKRKERKIPVDKKDKNIGRPPFERELVDNFLIEDRDKSRYLSGVELFFQLKNVCCKNDRLLASVYVGSSSTSGWTRVSSTEILTVTEAPKYLGANYIESLTVRFSLLQEPISTLVAKKAVYVVLERLNADSSRPNRDASKGSQSEVIAQAVIKSRDWFMHPIFKVELKTPTVQVDILNPLTFESKGFLGVIRLSSGSLAKFRNQATATWKYNPYAEMLYSFPTHVGQTMSLEQLFVSYLSTSVAQAFVKLLQLERYPEIHTLLTVLRHDEDHLTNELALKKKQEGLVGFEACEANIVALMELEKVIISREQLSDAMKDLEFDYLRVSEQCNNCIAANNTTPNIAIPLERGGGHLRRSVWKKSLQWQFHTTNLNIHLMTSRHFYSSEISSYLGLTAHNRADDINSDIDEANTVKENSTLPSSHRFFANSIHVIPTITLGCPAAHSLKFNDGGLRKTFSIFNDELQKQRWMVALQYPQAFPSLQKLISGDRNVATTLLKLPKCSNEYINSWEGKSMIMRRRLEIAHRLDMTCSQLLGFSLTLVKCIISLSVQVGGLFSEVLQRSLKIGFLISLESFLSSAGHELGMLEDLDAACSWLDTVTLRLVKGNTVCPNIRVGESVDVQMRRKDTGDLVVDLRISDEESEAIITCLNYMKNFRTDFNFQSQNFSFPNELTNVLCTVKLFGVVFSQGVNEVQTFANVSGSKEIGHQVDITRNAFRRLCEYYELRFLPAVDFQIATELSSYFSTSTTFTETKTSTRSSLWTSFSSGKIDKNDPSERERLSDILTKNLKRAYEKLRKDADNAVRASELNAAEKHVDILLKLSAFCRAMGGTVGILCKSGKDRTSMGVTLEIARSLCEDIGAVGGPEIVQLLRTYGVRRMNVFANTGQDKFAFNNIQKMSLPACYRPPVGTHGSNVVS